MPIGENEYWQPGSSGNPNGRPIGALGKHKKKPSTNYLQPTILKILPQFEQQVIEAAITEAENPLNVPLGELREIKRLDDLGRVREKAFIGQESFVKQMNRPGRRVVSFFADGRVYDAAKAAWR